MKMNPEETHTEFNSLITRYLSGELPPELRRDFELQLTEDSAKRAQFEEMRTIWNSVDSAAPGDLYDLDAEWDQMKEKIPELNRGKSLLYKSYRIAAVLLVGLLFGLGLIYGTRMLSYTEIVAQDQPVDLTLDDGTKLSINRDSRIRFKKRFARAERKVFLEGEAWFDVARDTSRPFVIDAGSAVVEVLGTSFNVNAYKENPMVEITVESGVVALTPKQQKQEQIVLKAGNSGTYHKQRKELELIPTSDPNHISWKTKELYFDGASLQEVVDLINRVYDVNLLISNSALASCQITVAFKNQSLEAILLVLESTLDLEISREGKQIVLEGAGCNP